MCDTCSAHYFKNWAERTCDDCARVATTGPVIIPLIFVGVAIVIGILVGLGRWCMGSTRDRMRRRVSTAVAALMDGNARLRRALDKTKTCTQWWSEVKVECDQKGKIVVYGAHAANAGDRTLFTL